MMGPSVKIVWLLWLCLVVAGCTSSSGNADDVGKRDAFGSQDVREVDPRDEGEQEGGEVGDIQADARDPGHQPVLPGVGCPAEIPFFHGFAIPMPDEYRCDPDVVQECVYPAEGCEPGTKPDNVCRCSEQSYRFTSDEPFHNCLPLPGEAPPGSRVRYLPEGRDGSPTCRDPAEQSRDIECSAPWEDAGQSTCTFNSDCGEAGVCLPTHYFGAPSNCHCHAAECLTDDDCPEGTACECGMVDPSDRVWGRICGGIWGAYCAHVCVPALCKSDADCGPRGICSPSPSICHNLVEMFACHHPDRVECFSHEECWRNRRCRFEPEVGGWRCHAGMMCD